MSAAEKIGMTDGVSEALDFIVEIDKMKSIQRRSLTYDGSHYENDAEHSWHLSVMALALARYGRSKGAGRGRCGQNICDDSGGRGAPRPLGGI